MPALWPPLTCLVAPLLRRALTSSQAHRTILRAPANLSVPVDREQDGGTVRAIGAGMNDAGDLQPEISSFRLHLAAEGKAATTVRTYIEAVRWFAARRRAQDGCTRWEEVGKQHVQEWIAGLLDCYSAAYASNQFRALQQFFKWLAAEEDIPDPMAGLRPPHVPDKPVPVFSGEELQRLERACAGRGFQDRRDAAVIVVSWRPGSACRSCPGSAATPATRSTVISTFAAGRSPSAARARSAWSSSAMTPPAPSAATSASAPGTPRHTGRSCGSASTTAAR
jgi:Phage integrase, N-terminal SAM-like domain